MTHNATLTYGLWPLAIINSAIFILFAFSFFKPQTSRDWCSFGAFGAFLVAAIKNSVHNCILQRQNGSPRPSWQGPLVFKDYSHLSLAILNRGQRTPSAKSIKID
jgi:hypothetical protein